jgi:hypothetical protein
MSETWVHGHSLEFETPANVSQSWRAGFYIKVEGTAGSDNWFHFAIPTTVNKQLSSVKLVFDLGSDATMNVAVWDGGTQIMATKSAPDSQMTITDSTGTHTYGTWNVDNLPIANYGVGISIHIKSGTNATSVSDNWGHTWKLHTMTLIGAGCSFVD